MSKIIIGVEPEAAEQPAIGWGLAYAAAAGASITLVTSWTPDEAELPPDRYDELKAAVKAHVEAALEARTGDAPVPDHKVVVSNDSFTDVLDRLTDDPEVDLIVVGHPTQKLARVTSDVLRFAKSSRVPVVFVRDHGDSVGTGPVVAAVEGTAEDLDVLTWAAAFARIADTKVDAAHVMALGSDSFPAPAGATRADVANAEIREELDDDVKLTILEGDAVEELAKHARQLQSPLVVAGRTHGMLLDKVPAHLVEAGDVSVAIVPVVTDHPKDNSAEHPWKALVGWAETALGRLTADREVQARGKLRVLDAEDGSASSDADPQAVLDEAELEVRDDHGELAPDAKPDAQG